jgi:nucleoside-diphosphate-sugar epimerase
VNVVLFGATGMVGAGALAECLADQRVRSVVALTRSPIGPRLRSGQGRMHPKLREVRRDDFFHYNDCHAEFAACDACFFCLGVSSIGMDERSYTRLTYDLTLAAAHALVTANRQMTFCYVSGVGTDSSERGRTMWARVKGKTENALLPNATTTTANLGRALIQVAAAGYPRPVLYSQDMNRLAVGRPFRVGDDCELP